jgi:hypothetical protein
MNAEERADLPRRPVRLTGGESCAQSSACRRMVERAHERLVGRFIAQEEPTPKQVPAAILMLEDETIDSYFARLKKIYKGNVIRDARKAEKAGLVCHQFPRALHIPDIVDINTSMSHRSGGEMKQSYLRSVDELGGAPTKPLEVEPIRCPEHYDTWWGVFEPSPGYTQGKVTTDERLVAYINQRRIGDFSLYSMIIGHGDYLRLGVMYHLHFQIMRWILARGEPATVGINTLMYAGFFQGGSGLQLWKKKTGFAPANLVLACDEHQAAPPRSLRSALRRLTGRTP